MPQYPRVEADLCVCADCFDDEGLKHFIVANADARECSFCGAESNQAIAAPLDKLVEHMLECLARDYDNPDDAGMVYETREGGYQGVVWDTHEFVQWHLGLELPNDGNGELLDAICHGLGDQLWCSAHLYSLGPDEALDYSWRRFCSVVKHQSRYFFTQNVRDTDDRELLTPSEVLDAIASYAAATGLIRKLTVGQEYFRARLQAAGSKLTTPRELGPPPPERAAQNRMSPAGIVMTYVSEDAETALDEAANKVGTYAVGKFRTCRDVRILDLASLPPVPSMFQKIPDSLEYDPLKALIFLHRVARDISRPIVRDDRVHIEYVPTQVVTEYLRSAKIPDADGPGKLDGIRYRSSRRDDGISLVLFADTENVVGATTGWKPASTDEWLELVDRIEENVSKDTLDALDAATADVIEL